MKAKASKPKSAAKAAPKKKKAEDDDEDGDGTPKKKQKAGPVVDYENRTIEEIYQKKTHLEQILLRPDTYIGAVEEQETQMWVWDEVNSHNYYFLNFSNIFSGQGHEFPHDQVRTRSVQDLR